LFAGFSGLIEFDPNKIVDSPSHLPIHLTDMKISGRTVQVGPGSPLSKSIVYTDGITLSHSESNFTLEFASLDFLHSRDTKYRYKMDGLDSEWNEVGSDQRVVSYTSLPAGSYVFRAQATVRAPWGESEAALRIKVLPPWWDSWWFKAAIAVLLALSVLAAYRYRLREIARQFDIRLEERVRERTRIARELHDSLLQGFQGLMFRLQAVRDLLPGRANEAVTALEKALERGDETITDAREAVHDLRSSSLPESDLEHSLKALGEEFGSEPHPAFKVIVEGKQRELAPLLRDDIYRVAREAFRNAVRHANAHNIEAEIEYGESDFTLRMRDDGDGIGRDVLARGKRAGHWGLQGMRERAEHIGGRLNVWSERKAGTEIELVIPAANAYGRRGPWSDQANEDGRERQD
jgi:signal transduction histidine kinase